jgi:hypothetical protein
MDGAKKREQDEEFSVQGESLAAAVVVAAVQPVASSR